MGVVVVVAAAAAVVAAPLTLVRGVSGRQRWPEDRGVAVGSGTCRDNAAIGFTDGDLTTIGLGKAAAAASAVARSEDARLFSFFG